MSSLQALARALGGNVVGRQVVCPGPGHSAQDRSLAVFPSPDAPGGFRVHSHSGDDWRDCRDHVAALVGLLKPGGHPADKPGGLLLSTPEPPTSAANASAAQALWQRGRSIRGTIAEAYLARRIGRSGQPLGIDLDHVCRFVPDARTGGERYPCLVTLCTDAATGEPTGGVHRTFLTNDARKAAVGKNGKKMLGPAGIARLWPDEDVTLGLFLAKGLETALAAALVLGLAPMWAALTSGAIDRFPVLGGIDALTVVADNDASGTGERVARAVCRRWRDAGREAMILMPDSIGDAADVVRAAA